jgi:hypothetical protein
MTSIVINGAPGRELVMTVDIEAQTIAFEHAGEPGSILVFNGLHDIGAVNYAYNGAAQFDLRIKNP